jgi:hypothetical protein
VPSSGPEAVAGPRQMLLDSSAPGGDLPKPSCVLDFSEDVARMEVELRRALFVTIVGTRPKVLGREVVEEVARFFQIIEDDMVIHHSKSEDFILFLPDERTATRVLNGGQVFRGPRFSLHFKRWTRFAHATATVLPCLVDVEVRGLPAHAWSRSTVERLLGDSCLVTEVFSEAMLRKDFSSFLLRAWCRNPDELHRAMDLIVVEPSFGGHEQQCLSYSVEVVVVPVDRPVGDSPPPSPPPDDDVLDKGGDSQRQFSSSRRSHSHSDDLRRGPIQRRLGPQPPRDDAGGALQGTFWLLQPLAQRRKIFRLSWEPEGKICRQSWEPEGRSLFRWLAVFRRQWWAARHPKGCWRGAQGWLIQCVLASSLD